VWRRHRGPAQLRTQGSILSRIDFTICSGFTWAIGLPEGRLPRALKAHPGTFSMRHRESLQRQ
jgi:hypothetical protein